MESTGTEIVYERKLTEAELKDTVLLDNLANMFFRQGYNNVCWLCNPPVATKSDDLTYHEKKYNHAQWHH